MQIVQYPNSQLKEPSLPIVAITDEIKQLAKDMLEFMKKSGGVGLASNQIGFNYQLAVVDLPKSTKLKDLVIINPQVLNYTIHDPCFLDEQCLSIPGKSVDKKRGYRLDIKYTNLDGKVKKLYLRGLEARIVAHELDHLNGRLIID